MVRTGSHEANALAVANKQVSAATNNSEAMRRLAIRAPESLRQIRIIWTSPLIPSDPLVWRKDLPADLKAKIAAWTLNYGRSGTADEIAKARKVLADLLRAPFNPSTDRQLIPIRKLEGPSKELMKNTSRRQAVRGGEGRQDRETPKKAEIAAINAEEKQTQDDPRQKRINAFVAAEKGWRQGTGAKDARRVGGELRRHELIATAARW